MTSAFHPLRDSLACSTHTVMDAWSANTNTAGLNRVTIENDGAGWYAFGFEDDAPSAPQWDYWFESLAEAKEFCFERWGVPMTSWVATDERHA